MQSTEYFEDGILHRHVRYTLLLFSKQKVN